MKKLLLIISLICINQLNAQVCFTPHADYNTDTNPQGVFSADFNNDGKADLVTCNAANDISVFLGDGTGTYTATPTTYTTPLFNPISITGGLLNSDGFIDLIITVPTNQIIVVLNDGAGGFTTSSTYTISGFSDEATAVDVNTDGFTDIITANNNTGNASVLLGDGTGSFGPCTNYNTAAGAQALVAGDFNADGKIDMAVCNGTANNISVLLGTGGGIFGAKVNTSVGLAPNGIVMADFNGDGKPDLVTSNVNGSNVTVLLNNGSGTFSVATNYTCGPNPTGIVKADFNGDGNMDVATVLNGGPTPNLAVLLGNGLGGLGTAINFATDAGPRSICTGDFNGDGKPDLATGNPASNDMSVLLNNILPVVKASATDTLVCAGESISLNGIGATTYTWTGGGPPPVNSQTFTPLGTITYTVTGTINSCSASDTLTIKVNPLPTVHSNPTNTAVCVGGSVTLTATGASTYSWTGGITNGVSFTPSSSSSYSVTGTDANGCSNTATASVTVNQLPTITANSATVCLGSPTTLTAHGGNTYTWSPTTYLSSGTGATVTANPTAIANYTYTITGKDVHTCVNTTTITVDVNPTPTVTAHATKTNVCSGSSVTLTGSGALSYTWTGGVTDGTPFVPSASQTFSVTGSDANNCTNTASVTVNVTTLSAPEICMVTTDSFFVNNIVYWDKTLYTNADSFIVYRLSLGSYLYVGSVTKDSSQLTDTKRNIGGPNGGDPNVSSWRYKLAIKDTCGNISAMSPYHETINIQQNNQNLSWNAYAIESPQAYPVNGYQVLRDSAGIGDWHVFVNTSGVSTNDPSYSLYPNANYRVDALGFSCNPTLKLASGNNNTFAAKVRSHSNSNNNRQSGIKQVGKNNQVSVYPNPSNGNFSVSVANFENTSVEVYNSLGEKIYTKPLNANTENITIEKFDAGVYFIYIKQNGAIVYRNNMVLAK